MLRTFPIDCSNGHRTSSDLLERAKFEILAKKGHLLCLKCESAGVTNYSTWEGLAAPAVHTSGKESARHAAAVAEKSKAEDGFFVVPVEVVGDDFYHESLAIDNGEAPERPIIGTPTADQVADLQEKGIPVVALGNPDKPKPN